MIKNTNAYRGKVEIAFKRNGKILEKTHHNTGLSDMALLFAKAVSGNLDSSSDIPRLLDIGYIVPSATRDSYSFSNGVWMSLLNSPAVIGGRQYYKDQQLDNWVGVLTSTVYYSDLNGGILEEVLKSAEQGQIELKVRLCSYDLVERKYFAEIPITVDEIRKIKDSTSAIFQWYTELLYSVEDVGEENVNSVSGDVSVQGSN